ncbi:sulfite exporter TauE/SafE family protein [soil metagenome]
MRGFTGFGAALIFMPLASTVFDPKLAAAALLVVDDVLTLPLALAALRVCRWRTVLPAAAAAMATSPLGAWLLARGDPIALRWTISAIVLAMLARILSGLRYHGNPRTEASAAVGAVAGLLGGVSQVSGPPVIAFWMSGPFPLATVRANLLVFFALASFSSFAAYLWYGFFPSDALWLMLLVTPVFAVALFAGARLFRVSQGAAYRPVAYIVIAVAAVTSMPVFDGVLR